MTLLYYTKCTLESTLILPCVLIFISHCSDSLRLLYKILFLKSFHILLKYCGATYFLHISNFLKSKSKENHLFERRIGAPGYGAIILTSSLSVVVVIGEDRTTIEGDRVLDSTVDVES